MTRSRKPWLALAAVGAAALSGCGSSGSPTTTNAANSSVEAQTSSTAASSGLSDAQAALAQAYAGSDRALPSSSPKPPKGRSPVMDYSLFSKAGILIDSFTDETEARAALQRLVASEPEAADDVALFISDHEGHVVEGPIHAVPTPVS